jgi:hypothetical protein
MLLTWDELLLLLLLVSLTWLVLVSEGHFLLEGTDKQISQDTETIRVRGTYYLESSDRWTSQDAIQGLLVSSL